MLELANATGGTDSAGNRTYDWDNKIIFKMSSKDIGDVVTYLTTGAKGDMKLIHDSSKAPGAGEEAGIKTLYIASTEKSWFWTLLTDKENKRSVPVDMSELVRIKHLLIAGISRIYGW